jgi:hypothetical protein
MGSQFTRAIRDEWAKTRATAQAGEPSAINRAAWPSGPLLARAVVSERSGPGMIYEPMPETKRRPAANAG